MSLINSFDNQTEEIIKPSDVIKKIPGFPETVIVTFSKKISDAFLSVDNIEKTGEVESCFDTTKIYKTDYKGKRLAVYKSMIGGPASAAILEEVIAKGGRKFLFFGSCGTLDRKISAGALDSPCCRLP